MSRTLSRPASSGPFSSAQSGPSFIFLPPLPSDLFFHSWTIVYDTIYACQDREDDVHAGVKSTALLFGSYVRPILIGFTLAFLALMLYAGVENHQGSGYFVLSCGGAALHFVWQFATWSPDVPADGGRKFNVSAFW